LWLPAFPTPRTRSPRRTDFLCFSPRMSSRVRPNRIAALATTAYVCWMEYAARQNARGGEPWFPYPL